MPIIEDISNLSSLLQTLEKQRGYDSLQKLPGDDLMKGTNLKSSKALPKRNSRYGDYKKRMEDSLDFGVNRGYSGIEENIMRREADILKFLG